MTRIKLLDKQKDIVIKMSDGNFGAMNALMEILKKGKFIDEDDAIRGMGYVLMLDSLEIYGTDIYVLHSDICGRDLAKTLAVIRSTQLGFLDGAILKDACGRQDYSGRELIPVEDLYLKVKERLTSFDSNK